MARIPPPDFDVYYRAVRFPDGVLVSPNGKLQFSTDDLAHALFVTGRAPGDQMLYGSASVWEWLHRASIIPAYVRRNYRGALVRSRLALDLDRSELVGLSYALGQAVTGIFCRTELSVSHLMHVDRYASHYGLVYGQTRKRADLFGLASNGWVVAEAKGRSRSMETSLAQKLIAQKRSISLIQGSPPWLAVGCVASFPTRTSEMEVNAFDPKEEAEDSVALSISLDRFMLAYYLPFLGAIEIGESADGFAEIDELAGRSDQLISATFGSFGIRVGLLREVADRVRRAASGELDGLYDDLQPALADGLSRVLGIFPDGTTVETRWGQEMEVSDWEG